MNIESGLLPFHLLFPFLSSILFVLGMMLAKQAIDRGASPWTGTFLGNLWLALFWAVIAAARGEVVPVEAWTDAAVVGLLFVLGQLFTYLAFQFGDVSVATPIFGVKVLMVAVLVTSIADENVPIHVWISGVLATFGVILVQHSRDKSKTDDLSRRRAFLTVVLALSAAFSLSLFDVCLQKWGARWNSFAFLPVMFAAAVLFSVFLLPLVDRPKRLIELKVLPWILGGTALMALQAMSMCFSLAQFGDAPRINIVYSLRGLWGVVLAWVFAKRLQSSESHLPQATMLQRLAGAVLLTVAVFWVIAA